MGEMGKVKLKLSLCLTKYHAIKTGEMEVSLHEFFTSALVRAEWSGLRPGRFTPR
jgi:hypothetical protein